MTTTTTVPAFLDTDGLRALFITNECAGLGHLRRTINLARAVTEADPDATALIVTGSAALGCFELPDTCRHGEAAGVPTRSRRHLEAIAPGPPVHVKYHGLNADFARLLGDAQLVDQPDRLRIISVGRLVEKKGFDLLVDAIAMLVDRGVDVTAVVAGESGDQEAIIRQRVTALGLDDRVEFLGTHAGADTITEPGWVSPSYGIKHPAPVVVARAHGVAADLVTVLSPGPGAVTIEDCTADGLLRCHVSRGAGTDLLEWSPTTDPVWKRRRTQP